ncbi:MAG TPA: hypothetical protein PK228_16090, partial [Saprospiraceae bacterium]|nr:hypothetical protein [Saprospiraceae bacterium]
FILLTLAISVIACKNDSKKETTDPATATDASTEAATQPPVDMAEAGTVLKEAKVTIEEIKSLRQKIDALPDNVKKTNAADIDNLRSTLEGMEEKEAYFIKELDEALIATSAPAPTGGSGAGSLAGGVVADKSAAIQDAAQSLKGYATELNSIKEQVEGLSKKQ